MGSRNDWWIRWTTSLTVALLALIAGVVSFGHMHELALAAGENQFTAALIPFSVDGMILASSLSLLVDSRSGRRGGCPALDLVGLEQRGEPGSERRGCDADGRGTRDRGVAIVRVDGGVRAANAADPQRRRDGRR